MSHKWVEWVMPHTSALASGITFVRYCQSLSLSLSLSLSFSFSLSLSLSLFLSLSLSLSRLMHFFRISVLLLSHVTYDWVMSQMIKSCVVWTSHVSHKRPRKQNNVRRAVELCNIWQSHVTHKQVMSHMYKSCHKWTNHVDMSLSHGTLWHPCPRERTGVHYCSSSGRNFSFFR